MEINAVSLGKMPSVLEGRHTSHRLTAVLGLKSEEGKVRRKGIT